MLLHDSGFVLQQLYNFGGLFWRLPSAQPPGATEGEDTGCDRKFAISNDELDGPPEDTRILEEQLLSMTDNRSAW